jgi:hypothetical protein
MIATFIVDMNSTVLGGAVIGVPGKIVREVTEEEVQATIKNVGRIILFPFSFNSFRFHSFYFFQLFIPFLIWFK